MCVKIIISRLYHLMSPCIYYQNILLDRVFKLLSFFFPFVWRGEKQMTKKALQGRAKVLAVNRRVCTLP